MTTHATFSDQVTMAQVSVTGGTLDLQANSGNGPSQAWTGTIAAAVTGMAPGDEASGTVAIRNNGSLPFSLKASSTGTDASGCFGWFLRETSATGATKAASWPVVVAGMGTATGSDAASAPFATAVTNVQLNDNTAADAVWETDDVKTFTLTVRMKTSCTTNAATGGLNLVLDAIQ